MKELACGDVVPGCDARFSGEDDNAVLQQAGAHAAEAHGMADIPADVLEKVKSAIRSKD